MQVESLHTWSPLFQRSQIIMELFTDCCLLATKCILSLSGFHRTGYEGLSTSSASLSKGIQGIERIDTLRDYAAYLFLKKFFVNFDKISRVFEP